MSYMKEALADEFDDLTQPEPMRPIRLEYLTTTRDRAIQTDVLERLGLLHTFVGQNLFALNEPDSISLALEAVEQLHAEGNEEPDEVEAQQRAEILLARLVVHEAEQSGRRSAITTPVSVAVQRIAEQLRADADAILEARGIQIRADLAKAVAESAA